MPDGGATFIDGLLTLSVPFMLGVIVGREFRRTPKPTTYHRFGEHIRDMILKVIENRQWSGPGCAISVTDKMQFEGREIEIIVREGA